MPSKDPLALDNQLCFALYSASLTMTQLYKPLLEPLGLTYPQYLVMLILWQEDKLNLKDIGAQLGQKSGALTPVIKRLEQEGLVQRLKDPLDERALRIGLTEAGSALRTQALHINQCLFQACAMEKSELIELKDKIISLRDNLQQHSK